MSNLQDDSDDLPGGNSTRAILVGIHKDIKYLAREMAQEKESLMQTIRDHEARIRKLEEFRWWIIGAIFGSAALTGVVSKLVFR